MYSFLNIFFNILLSQEQDNFQKIEFTFAASQKPIEFTRN